MNILVVHQYYLMPGQFGGSRFNEMARLWSEAGHRVTVVAGTMDHGTGEAPDRYRGRWIVREMDGPVTVYRCHVPGTYGKSYPGRMWAFFGWTLSASTAAFTAPKPDIVIATSPPLIAAFPGWIAARARLHKVPWIFEIRDLWPESAVTTGVLKADSFLTKLLYAVERKACRSARLVNVLTPAFQTDIVGRGLVDASKVVFVPNGADIEHFRPCPQDLQVRRELGWGDRFVAMYAGAHSRANAVRQLIDTAEVLRGRSEILIACVGDGPERVALTEDAKARGLENIVFHGPQAKSEMPRIVNACDIGMAVLQDNPTFRTVYPNKVFDYMACARPVLLAIDGVARDLVCGQARAGLFAQPEDGRSIADAILKFAGAPGMREEMGRNGRAWVVANAGRQALADRYIGIMRSVLPAHRQAAY